jgi:hypothetical protein
MISLGGRKFIGFIVILSAAGIARYYSKTGLTHEDVLFLLGAYGSFAFGNVANTLIALRGGGSGEEGGAPAAPVQSVDTAPLEARINEFEQETYNRLTVIESGVTLQNQAIQAVLKRAQATPATSNDTPTVAQANRRAIAKYIENQ